MNKTERYLQFRLTTVLTSLLLINLISGLRVYQTSQAIKTSIIGGSSLTERYLML